MSYSIRWIIVGVYTICLFVVTPYLPKLIQAASSRWSNLGVSRFVLGVEIAIAFMLTILAVYLMIRKKKKSFLFFISIVCIFFLSFIIFQFIPNPYEFTHLPEYAVLSMLILWALKKETCIDEKEGIRLKFFRNYYFQSGILTGIIGSADEIYQLYLPNRAYTWYDIFLNILGGILGLLIIWSIKRKK
jgi:hypothetical protein